MFLTGLTIAVDLDGTCAKLAPALSAWWADTGNTPSLSAEPDCWHWWRTAGIHDEAFAAGLAAFAESGGFGRLEPYRDALDGINTLFDAGHELLAVTSRLPTRAVERSTYEWIASFYLPVRSVMIGPNAKLEAECDIIVDDDPATLEAVGDQGEAVGLLIDRSWNRDATGLPRVTWGELPNIVGGLARKTEGLPVSERRWEMAGLTECMIG